MMQIPLLDRSIILINDNDGLAAIARCQHRRKLTKSKLIIGNLSLTICNIRKIPAVIIIKPLIHQNINMTDILLPQSKTQTFVHIFPIGLMRILKG